MASSNPLPPPLYLSQNLSTNPPTPDLRSSTKSGENPTFTTEVRKQESILQDKAVGGMDNDGDHVGNVAGGLKA